MCWISDGASQTSSERDGGELSGRSSARLDALGGEVVNTCDAGLTCGAGNICELSTLIRK